MLPIIILAGGLASRLGDVAKKTPKALLPIAGKPFMVHQLELLKKAGVKDIIICAGYLGEQIESCLGNGRIFDMNIKYSFDWPDLLGTGGAIKKALPLLKHDKFLIMYGDSYLDVAYKTISDEFELSTLPGLMTVYKNEGRYDASNVIFKDNKIIAYDKQSTSGEMKYIDYGLGGLSTELLSQWPDDKFDLAHVYTTLSKNDKLYGIEIFNRFYEIGSHQGLAELDEMLSK